MPSRHKKYVLVNRIGVMPYQPATKRWSTSATYMQHLLDDMPNMSDDTLIMMTSPQNSREVILAARAELFMRCASFSWKPYTLCTHTISDADSSSFLSTLNSAVDDDFTPFGEDGTLPKSLQRKHIYLA